MFQKGTEMKKKLQKYIDLMMFNLLLLKLIIKEKTNLNNYISNPESQDTNKPFTILKICNTSLMKP